MSKVFTSDRSVHKSVFESWNRRAGVRSPMHRFALGAAQYKRSRPHLPDVRAVRRDSPDADLIAERVDSNLWATGLEKAAGVVRRPTVSLMRGLGMLENETAMDAVSARNLIRNTP
jgi:hypothetical protein